MVTYFQKTLNKLPESSVSDGSNHRFRFFCFRRCVGVTRFRDKIWLRFWRSAQLTLFFLDRFWTYRVEGQIPGNSLFSSIVKRDIDEKTLSQFPAVESLAQKLPDG